MSWFQQITAVLGQLFKWWFVVLPWEQAIRVRLGSRVTKFNDGLHFQIPFIDRIYIQNVRRRIAAIHGQTITTQDGKTVTVAGSLSYRITDIEKLHQTLHQPESSIMQAVQGIVSDYVVNNDLENCSPKSIAESVTANLDLHQYGLNETEFFLTDFAVVRTYRLLNDTLARYSGDELNTNMAMNHHVMR